MRIKIQNPKTRRPPEVRGWHVNVDSYSRHISYDGLLILSFQTPRDLQLSHLQTVPFENLDVHLAQLNYARPGRTFREDLRAMAWWILL
jgi:hypothetical protein